MARITESLQSFRLHIFAAAVALPLAVAGCGGTNQTPTASDRESVALPAATQVPEFNQFGFAVEPLGAGVKEEGVHVRTHPRRAVKVVQAKIHLEPGGGNVPWHTHPGPVIGVVTGGGVLTVISENCAVSRYPTGSTFRAPENIHTARNETGDPVTVVAQFIIEANKKDGSFAKPTTLEPANVRAELDQKCGL